MLDYEISIEDEEFFYNALMCKVLGNFSPFEIRHDLTFPNKAELGGVILKLIGSGAIYFKIQTEMPSENEVELIYNVGRYLEDVFGGYVSVYALCTPDIEIRDIDISADRNFHMSFVSSRKNDGDEILYELTKKLEDNEEFTVEDHLLKFMLPFMGRRNDEEFEAIYLKFLSLYEENGLKTPDVKDLSEVPTNYLPFPNFG